MRFGTLFFGWFRIQFNCSVMNRRLTIEKKLEIIEKLTQPRATQKSVAESMGVSRRTVQKIIANRDILKKMSNVGYARKRCKVASKSKFEHINQTTFEWFKRMRDKHGEIPINESVICAKAMHFSTAFGVQGFKASHGWFRCWRNSHCLNSFKVRLFFTYFLFLRFVENEMSFHKKNFRHLEPV